MQIVSLRLFLGACRMSTHDTLFKNDEPETAFGGGAGMVHSFSVATLAGGDVSAFLSGAALLNSDIVRDGADLVITAPTGVVYRLDGFFDVPDLQLVSGKVVLSAAMIAGITGQHAPLQVAQLGGTAESPVGTVIQAKGAVSVVRNNQEVVLEAGDPVYMNDKLVTGDDAAIGLKLVDDSEFSLGANGQMVIDDLVYDPAEEAGSAKLSLIGGAFSFVSGKIAKSDTDAMTVETPVATVGIRGTRGVLKISTDASSGDVDFEAVLLNDQGGSSGELILTTTDGQSITVNSAFGGLRATVGASGQVTVQQFQAEANYVLQNYGGTLSFLPSDNASNNPENKAAANEERNDAGAQQQQGNESDNESDAEQGTESEGAAPEGDAPDGEGDEGIEGDGTAAEGDSQGADENAAGDAEATPAPPPPAANPNAAPPAAPPPSGAPSNNTPLTGNGGVYQPAPAPAAGNTTDNDDPPVMQPPPPRVVEEDEPQTDGRETLVLQQRASLDLSANATPHVIYGSAGDDTVHTGAGNDTLRGRDGDDYLYAGSGDDIVYGGRGADTIIGGSGHGDDIYYGGNGAVDNNLQDWVYFSSATSALTVDLAGHMATGADIGTDRLYGIEHVLGGDGDDLLRGDAGLNTLIGGNGNDTLKGNGGNDMLIGNSGNDVFVVYGGQAGKPTMDGGIGHDTLMLQGSYTFTSSDVQAQGIETIMGDHTDQTMILTDTAEADLGHDVVFLDMAGGIDTFVLNNVGGHYDIANVEELIGGNSHTDEVLLHDAAGADIGFDRNINILHGSHADDTFKARDSLTAQHQIHGNDGSDTLVLQQANNQLGSGISGVETLIGTMGDDTLSFTGDLDYVHGMELHMGAGQDTIAVQGSTGSVVLDVWNAEHIYGDAQHDTTVVLNTGGANAISISAGAGQDAVALNAADYGHLDVAGVEAIYGTNDHQAVRLYGAYDGVSIDLLGGQDTLNLQNAGSVHLYTRGVESLIGGSGVDTIHAAMGAGQTDIWIKDIEAIYTDPGTSDTVTLQETAGIVTVDLGGTEQDMLRLNGASHTVSVAGVDTIAGGAGHQQLDLHGAYDGISVDLAGGNDALHLHSAGASAVHVTGVETVLGSSGLDTVHATMGAGQTDIWIKDIAAIHTDASTSDTVTLQETAGIVTVDLGGVEQDVLRLNGASHTVSVAGVDTITGGAGHQQLDLHGAYDGISVDLAGGNDALHLHSTGASALRVTGVETVLGSSGLDTVHATMGAGQTDIWIKDIAAIHTDAGTSETVTLQETAGIVTVDLGGAEQDVLRLNGASHTIVAQNFDHISAMGAGVSLDITHSTNKGAENELWLRNVATVTGSTATVDTVHLDAPLTEKFHFKNIENVHGSSADDVLVAESSLAATSAVHGGSGQDTLSLQHAANILGANITGIETLQGTAMADTLTLRENPAALANTEFRMGAGQDTIILENTTAASTLNLWNVEHITGDARDNSIILHTGSTGRIDVDLSAGADTLHLQGAVYKNLVVQGVEYIAGVNGNQDVSLSGNYNNASIDLAGGDDTIALSGGDKATVSLTGVEKILGGGATDIVKFTAAPGQTDVFVQDVRSFHAAPGTIETVTLHETAGVVTMDLGGAEQDILRLSGTQHTLMLENVDHITGIGAGVHLDISQSMNKGSTNEIWATNVATVTGAAATQDTVHLEGSIGSTFAFDRIDAVLGTNFDDVLIAQHAMGVQDRVDGGGGTDVLRLTQTQNTLGAGVATVEKVTGTAQADTLFLDAQGGVLSTAVMDLGAGNDTVYIQNSLSGTHVTLSNVENIYGDTVNNTVELRLDGTSSAYVDLAEGADTLRLTAPYYSQLDLSGVENLQGADRDQFVKLTGDYDHIDIDLKAGNNTLALVSARTAETITLHGDATVLGQAGVSDVVDYDSASAGQGATIQNVHKFIGDAGIADTVTLLESSGMVFVELGGDSADKIRLAAGSHSLTANDVHQLVGLDGVVHADISNSINTGVTGNDFTVTGIDTLQGGAINDVVRLSDAGETITLQGIDYIYDGAGDDVITVADNEVAFDYDFSGGGFDTLIMKAEVMPLPIGEIAGLEKRVTGAEDDVLQIAASGIQNGMTLDGGLGSNTVVLGESANTFTVENMAQIQSAAVGAYADVITSNTAFGSGATIAMGDGLDTLKVAGSQTFSLESVEVVEGSAGNDAFVIESTDLAVQTVNGGAGHDAVTSQGANADHYLLANVEHFTGNSSFNNTVSLAAPGALMVESTQQVNGTMLDDYIKQTALNAAGTMKLFLDDGVDTFRLDATGAQQAYNFQGVDIILGNEDAQNIRVLAGNIYGTERMTFDLGDGMDTLTLSSVSAIPKNITDVFVRNVEHIAAGGGSETIHLMEAMGAAGTISMDLAAGADTVILAEGTHALDLAGVEVLRSDSNPLSIGREVHVTSSSNTISLMMGSGHDYILMEGATTNIYMEGVDTLETSAGDAQEVTVLNTVPNEVIHLVNVDKITSETYTNDTFSIAGTETTLVSVGTGSDIVIFEDGALNAGQAVLVDATTYSDDAVWIKGETTDISNLTIQNVNKMAFMDDTVTVQNIRVDGAHLGMMSNYGAWELVGRTDQVDHFVIDATNSDYVEANGSGSLSYTNWGAEDRVIIDATAKSSAGIMVTSQVAGVREEMRGSVLDDSFYFGSGDILIGGAGNDTFQADALTALYHVGSNGQALDTTKIAVLQDFSQGSDKIQLGGAEYGNLGTLDNTNFVTLDTAYAGDNITGNAKYDMQAGVFIFDANNNLIYDDNGSADGYTIIAHSDGDGIAASDIHIV
jgi:Ca2+-binding RTX toxin-like protein